MALKSFKPYTKSVRGTILVDKKHLWKGKPYKPLLQLKIHQVEEIILEELPLETLVVDTSKNIEILIFIEKNLVKKLK